MIDASLENGAGMKRWIFIVLPVLILLGFVGWRVSQKRAEAAAQLKQRQERSSAPVGVETVKAARRDVVKTFEAVGSAEAPQAVDLAPKVTGRILFLAAREGDRVTAGQVLVRIDPAEVQALVRQKEAALAQAQARLAEAQVTASSTNVGVVTDINRQQAGVSTAQAQAGLARADYEGQIAQAQAAVTDAQGRVAQAEAAIAQAQAGVATAQANVTNARAKRDQQQTLFAQGATAQQTAADAQTAYEVQVATLNEAVQRQAAAVAARNSSRAQLVSAQKQVAIATNKARADLATSRASVAQARASLVAAQANRSKTPAYQSNLKALAAAVSAADADLRATQTRLSDTTLLAPLTGVVTQRNLDVGGLAVPNQSILTVQAVQSLWVTAAVPEEISRKVFQGQTAQVTFDALPGQPYTGRVVQVNPAADPQSRQFTLRVRIDNREGRIKPGMSGTVSLVTDRAKSAVTVPNEAIKPDPKTNQPTVTVVTPGEGGQGVAHLVPVETGLSDSKGVVVTRGLDANQLVVIMAGRDLKDGQAVRVGGGKKSGNAGSASGAAGGGASASSGGTARAGSAAVGTEAGGAPANAPVAGGRGTNQ